MKYFTFAEFERSDTARKRGINNSIPNEEIRQNIIALVEQVLDPLREAYGHQLIVTSGYRCPALNNAVKGSKTSHHMRGMAADITTGNLSKNRVLFNLIQKLNLPYTQLIDESRYAWVHVSLDPKNIKRQVLHL